MGSLCRNFHMLCDRPFQYTLVLLYVCVKTPNVHRNKKCSGFHVCLFSESYDFCDFDIGCSSVSTNFVAWVSGVSGERGKNGSEKGREREIGREVKERNAWHRCFYWSLPPSHSMIQYHPIKITSGHRVVSFTCQKAKINLTLQSGRAPVLVLLRFRFFLKPPMRSFRILVMENLPFSRNYNICFKNCASERSPTLGL